MEEIVPNNNPNLEINSRRVRPQKEQSLNCPRCNSTNTKFCYYNNYSLSQPRYFCKTCRRYWTEGGSLRNIPVGGGSRKNRRPNSSSSSSSPSSTITSSSSSKNMVPPPQNPTKIHEMTHDLNLGFPTTHDFKTISELIQVPNFKFDGGNSKNQMVSVSASATASASSGAQLSAMELLTGFTTRGLGGSFVPIQIGDPNAVYHHQNGYHSIPEYKQGLSFSLDGGIQESNGGRLLFPFEDLKQVPSTTTGGGDHGEQNRDHQNHGDSNGYWNGMLGGGSW